MSWIVDAVVYNRVIDPVKVTYNVEDFEVATVKLAQTNLRNQVGDLNLDEILTSHEHINAALGEILDTATDKWGVKRAKILESLGKWPTGRRRKPSC